MKSKSGGWQVRWLRMLNTRTMIQERESTLSRNFEFFDTVCRCLATILPMAANSFEDMRSMHRSLLCANRNIV
jgi:hypothetical protein